jgi:long-chain fatty acid transport protein
MAFIMERIMELRRVALLTLSVVVLLSGVVLAGGWQYPEIGARAKAMGGAYRGIADDGDGAYYNPAGMAFINQNIFNLTAEVSTPRPSVNTNFKASGYGFGFIDGQTRYPKDNSYLMGETSLFFRPKKADKLVLGLAFYQTYDQNADMNLFQLSPSYNDKIQLPDRNHHTNFDVVTWQPTAAMKFKQDRLAIGVGVQIHRGDIFVDQIRLLNNPYPYPLDVRPYDKFPELWSVDGFGYGVGANIGVQFKVSPKVTIGANYVSSSKITMDGSSKERIYFPYNFGIAHLYQDPNANAYQKEVDSTYKGALIGYDGDFSVSMKLPSEFGFGVSLRPNEKTLLAADLVYTRWSEFQDFQIKFSNRQTIVTTAYFDRWNGLFTDVTVPFQWKDRIRVSLGMEKIINDRWTLRGGYMFDPSPIPDETLNELFMDPGTKHHLNGGAGFKLNDKISFSAGLELVVFAKRTVSTLADVNHDGYWDNIGGTYKNMSFNTAWALSYRF